MAGVLTSKLTKKPVTNKLAKFFPKKAINGKKWAKSTIQFQKFQWFLIFFTSLILKPCGQDFGLF